MNRRNQQTFIHFIINFIYKMFEQKLTNFDQLPVKENQRKCADVLCTAVGGIFALTLFIISLVMMNKQNYYKTNFPTDSDDKPCAYGDYQKFRFVYFPDVNDANTRVCVSACPQSSDLQVECKQNSMVVNCGILNIYQTNQNFERLGGFCLPEDEGAREKLVENANLGNKWRFLNTYDVIRLSLLISLGVGILWTILVQCLPKIMNTVAIVFGSLLLLVAGIILLADNPVGWEGIQFWKIILGVIFIIFAIAFFAMLCLYRKRLQVSAMFLDFSTRFLGRKPINFVFIPIFLALTVGLIVLCLFEYLAVSSSGEPVKQEDDIYLHSKGSKVLTALIIIEFIWGMQFLKDTFNFFISGNATEWYANQGDEANFCIPVIRFFKYNFGSVVGGSFLNAFFNFIDFLYETLRCYPDGCCGVCAPCCNFFSNICGCFFDLVRNDAYAYVNLTGIPYCNAARNCEVLCQSSRLFVGSQSVMFFYRLCAHAFCVALTTMICYGIMKGKIHGISTWSLFLIVFLAYCVVTYFIDIHADAAEGLQIAYLLDDNFEHSSQRKQKFKGFKEELFRETEADEDGKCGVAT